MSDPATRREPPLGLAGPLGPLLYAAGRAVCDLAFTVLWRRTIIGAENVPAEEGVILASNHASFADPPLVGSSLPRPVFFMAKQELFNAPLFGWLIKQLNAFPIRRVERDLGAFRMAQRILAAGHPLILFLEGTRQPEGRLGRAKPGVGMLAMKTGCRVVPVYVHDSHRLGRFARPTVIFGRPMAAAGGDDYQAFSDQVMAAIAKLKEERFGPS